MYSNYQRGYSIDGGESYISNLENRNYIRRTTRMHNTEAHNALVNSYYSGRISNIRRFFCLFVMFDFFFTALIWMICIMLNGDDIRTIIENQVIHYTIQTSLFDVVAAAAIRFIILLFFYTLLNIKHWIVVALSTALTCTFLVAKVYFYDWSQTSQQVFQVLLILVSFILVWGEAWVLDIMVLPQESLIRIWDSERAINERSPLLHPYRSVSDNLSNFYTPLDSPTHSDNISFEYPRINLNNTDNQNKKNDLSDKEENNDSNYFLSLSDFFRKLPKNKVNEFKMQASVITNKCYEFLNSNDWNNIRMTNEGDVISVLHLPKMDGTFLKIEGLIDLPAEKLLDHLHDHVDLYPSWNQQILFSKIVSIVDKDTDFTYQAIKGTENSKDYTILRHRKKMEPFFMSTSISCSISGIPVRSKLIRIERGINCYATWCVDKEKISQCAMAWIVNVNIQGAISERLIHISLVSSLEKFMQNLRSHINEIKS